MKLYHDVNSAVLRLSNKPDKIIKGLTSNTRDAAKTAFIDLFGKIVVTCYQISVSSDEILLIVQKQFVSRLQDHLKKYLKLTKTKLEETDYDVYFDLGDEYIKTDNDYVLDLGAARLVVTSQTLESTVRDEEFNAFRILHAMPVQGVDYDQEMLLNLGDLEYVSFTKGCYIGQEIIARVHNLGKPPKKLVVNADQSGFEFVKNE